MSPWLAKQDGVDAGARRGAVGGMEEIYSIMAIWKGLTETATSAVGIPEHKLPS